MYLNFNDLAINLYGKNNAKAKGELLTTLLSFLGGLAVLYGLHLNNKRIKEQTKQNNIAISTSNDKRFGDAIGYLGSENTSIVLGGIYTLFQLAKEDSKYIPLVNNLYSGYLKDNSRKLCDIEEQRDINKQKPPVIIQAIIDIYFNDNSIFKDEQVDLSDTTLIEVYFKNVNHCIFTNSVLKNCTFTSKVENSDFSRVKMVGCIFERGLFNVHIYFSNLDNCRIENINKNDLVIQKCRINISTAKNIEFVGNSIAELNIYNSHFVQCKFNVRHIDSSQICFSSPVLVEFLEVTFWDTKMRHPNIHNSADAENIIFDHNCKNIPSLSIE